VLCLSIDSQRKTIAMLLMPCTKQHFKVLFLFRRNKVFGCTTAEGFIPNAVRPGVDDMLT